MIFPNDLEFIQEAHIEWVKAKGWYANKTPLESIALIASEIGEAANECRGVVPTGKLGSELADIILRVLVLADELGLDMTSELWNKIEYNAEHKKNTPGRIK